MSTLIIFIIVRSSSGEVFKRIVSEAARGSTMPDPFLVILYLCVFIVPFLFMIGVAWFLHKYVRYGVGWYLH